MEEIKTVLFDLISLDFNKLIQELDLYFQIVKKIKFEEIKKKLDIPKKDYLRKFNLEEKNLKNILYLPEILKLAEEIKENNFNEFKNYWFTEDYYHHNHGYTLKELLYNLEKYSEIIKKLRLKLLDNNEKIPVSGFIEENFENVGLHFFENFKDLIIRISKNRVFIKTLPILLRILFENILYQIFLKGLHNKHKLFFFNQKKTRARDFSELIALLNILKDREFKIYSRGVIVQKHIDNLIFFKDLGNYEVHQIFTQIDSDFPNQYKEKVNITLKALLHLYNNLNNENNVLSNETIEIIKDKIFKLDDNRNNEDSIAKASRKKNQIIDNKEIPLDKQSTKEKMVNDFYQYLFNIFTRFKEIEKPPNDNNFKDNANYIYFKFEIWDEEHIRFLSQNEAKHLIIDASDKLKSFYSKVCEKSYDEIKDKIHGYFLKFADYRIKVEVNKVSIHRSKQYLFKESSSLKDVLDFILSEIINISLQEGIIIQYSKLDQKLSNEKIDTLKMHFNELFGFLDNLFYNDININELRSIISYITKNEQDFQNYLKFHREPTTPTSVQNFYFLRGEYRIHFLFNKKPNIYLNPEKLRLDAEKEPEKAKEAYSKLKYDIIENLRTELNINLI